MIMRSVAAASLAPAALTACSSGPVEATPPSDQQLELAPTYSLISIDDGPLSWTEPFPGGGSPFLSTGDTSVSGIIPRRPTS